MCGRVTARPYAFSEEPVSKQINFFANAVDTERIHDWLRREFPGLAVIRGNRGSLDELKSRVADDSLAYAEMLLLVPGWARERVVPESAESERHPDLFAVDLHKNPAIEYSLCRSDSQGDSVWIGRFYWAYGGELAADERRQIDRLLRWVRTQSISHPVYKAVRLIKETAVTAAQLVFWSNQGTQPALWSISFARVVTYSRGTADRRCRSTTPTIRPATALPWRILAERPPAIRPCPSTRRARSQWAATRSWSTATMGTSGTWGKGRPSPALACSSRITP